MLVINIMDISCQIDAQVKVTGLIDKKSNIGSGNGLVLSGNKPVPELTLTKFCDSA